MPGVDAGCHDDVQPRTRPAQSDPHRRVGSHPARSAVLALAAIITLALTLRSAVTAITPLLGRAGPDLSLTPALTGVLGALPPLMFSLAGVVTVRLMRRVSAERVAVGVLLLAGVGQLARPWLPEAVGFLALTGLTLLAMGVGNIVLPPLVKAWFPGRIGPVTGAYVTALALGTAVPALVAVPLADAAPGGSDWQVATAVWGVAGIAFLPLMLLLARRSRALPGLRTGSGAGMPVHRSPLAWALAALFMSNSLNLYAMFTWLPARLLDAGLSEAAAGTQTAVFAGIGLVPSLLLPPVLARYGRTFALVTSCAGLFAVGYAGLLLAPLTLTTLWSVLAGLGGGTFPIVLTLIGLRSGTPATAGALAGFAQGIGYLGAATGPVLFGVLHDLTDAWLLPFGFLGLTLVMMVLAGWVCSGDVTVDDQLRARENNVTGADTLVG